MKIPTILIITLIAGIASAETYPIVDTGQVTAYGSHAGQDAHYSANKPNYRNNGDGTVSNLVTGLMWTQDPGEKTTFSEGKITEQEFMGPMERFILLDLDSDGILTEEETAASQPHQNRN